MNRIVNRIAPVVALSGIVALIFTPVFIHLSKIYIDFGWHLEFARLLYESGTRVTPHFAFHAAVALLQMASVDPLVSAVLLTLRAPVAPTT